MSRHPNPINFPVHDRNTKTPDTQVSGVRNKCLAVTYFHMGIHTIIGAESFHGPVRDGKAWDQLAMAARRKLYKSVSRYGSSLPLIYSLINGDVYQPHKTDVSLFKETIQSPSNDRVKPHEQLVSVSFTHCCASTPDLSTSWSRTTL